MKMSYVSTTHFGPKNPLGADLKAAVVLVLCHECYQFLYIGSSISVITIHLIHSRIPACSHPADPRTTARIRSDPYCKQHHHRCQCNALLLFICSDAQYNASPMCVTVSSAMPLSHNSSPSIGRNNRGGRIVPDSPLKPIQMPPNLFRIYYRHTG